MGYANKNNSWNRGYSNNNQNMGNFDFNSSYVNRASNRNNGNAPRYKKSGAKFSQIKTGKSTGMMSVNAWLVTRQGLLTIKAFGYAKAKGDKCEFQKAVAEIINTSSGQKSTFPVLINVTTRRMKIKELGWIVTAAGGGQTRNGKRVTGAVVKIR